LSGHSARVGAALDLSALNIDMTSVMQAGRQMENKMLCRCDTGNASFLSAEEWPAQLRSKDALDNCHMEVAMESKSLG